MNDLIESLRFQRKHIPTCSAYSVSAHAVNDARFSADRGKPRPHSRFVMHSRMMCVGFIALMLTSLSVLSESFTPASWMTAFSGYHGSSPSHPLMARRTRNFHA